MNRTLPAEWEKQSAIQLTWPHEDTDWNYILADVTACYVRIASEISKREPLLIVCKNEKEVRQELEGNANLANIRFEEMDTNDTWARDHGAITVRETDGSYSVMDFCFNGWGMKFAANRDNLITRELNKRGVFKGAYRNHLDFVLEGGSIESDGKGTILTTSECLLSNNRNETLNKQEIEKRLHEYFGADHVLWLENGYLAGDDTDSHIDTLARLCPDDTIAYVKCTDQDDEHYAALLRMEEELKELRTKEGKPFNLLALPMADKVEMDEERLPATYANFLIMNGAVLMPTYNTAKDEEAKAVLKKAFPDREIVGCDCVPLIRQHGSLHCITMQFPEDSLIMNN